MLQNQHVVISHRVLNFLRHSLWLGCLLVLSAYSISYANESKPVEVQSCLPDEMHRGLPPI